MAETREEPPLGLASPEAPVWSKGDKGTVWLLCQGDKQGRVWERQRGVFAKILKALGAHYLTSLCLSCLNYKMQIIVSP